MALPRAGRSIRSSIVRNYWTWALPRLVELPPSAWDQAIRNARNIEFDLVERIAIVFGSAFVAFLLRFDTEQVESASVVTRFVFQFVAAVPLLLLVVGPFFLRRARRGLDMEIERLARDEAKNSGNFS